MEQNDFKDFIERVKDKVDIADVAERIGMTLKRDGGGNYRAPGMGGMIISSNYGNYHHYQNEGQPGWHGDVIALVQNYGSRPEFMDALRYVAELAGEPMPTFSGGDSAAAKSYRARAELWDITCNWLSKTLWNTPAAVAYARGRGWTDDTIKGARLGFTGGAPDAKADLRGEFNMHEHDPLSPAAVAILGLEASRGADGIRDWCKKYDVNYDELPESGQKGRIWGLLDFPRLVYPHIERGRVVYFSARNLKRGGPGGDELIGDSEHKSWNLPKVLVGPRPRFLNALYYSRANKTKEPNDNTVYMITIGEGPADGITWAQFGVPSIDLVGVGAGDDIAEMVKGYDVVFAATDNGEVGRGAAEKLCDLLGPLTRVVRYPVHKDDGEDANDWLKAMLKSGAVPELDYEAVNFKNDSVKEQREMAHELLGVSRPYIVHLANEVKNLSPLGQEMMTKKIAKLAATLPNSDYVMYRKEIGEATGVGVGKLDDTINEIQKEALERAKSEKKDEGELVFTTGGWIHGHLVELLYDRESNRTMLAVRFPDGSIQTVPHVMIEGQRYAPIMVNSIIEKNAVRLPSKINDVLMSEQDLIAACRWHSAKYFDFGTDSFFEMVTSLYPLFSHLYDGFRELSYLRALGDYGTGKTRYLKTVGLLCYRPIYVTGGSSAASLFRLLDLYRGTLVLNEGDFGNSDEATIIAKILNGGTERDESITRVKKGANGELDLEAFQVFGPKVIATRREFDDRAIASRCLTMEMAPMNPHPRIPINIPPEFEDEALEIRNMLITYRMHHAQPDYVIDQSLIDRSIEPRLSQVTLSMISMMKDEQAREQIRAFLRDYNQEVQSERYGTQTARVLEGIIRAWAWGPVSEHPSDELRVYLKDIARATNDVTDEQNRKMGDSMDDDYDDDNDSKRKTKRMTSRKVSSIMKKYLQLKTLRATDGSNAEYKGTTIVDWDTERIQALCERWGVEWLERGSVPRPVIVRLDQDSFEKERESWHDK